MSHVAGIGLAPAPLESLFASDHGCRAPSLRAKSPSLRAGGEDLRPLVERYFAPGVVWDQSRSLAEPAVYRGREEALRFIQSRLATFGELRYEPDQLIDADADRVVLIGHFTGRGRASGAPFRELIVAVRTLSDGQTIRIEYFGDKLEEALPSVGRSTSDLAGE